MSNLHAAGQPRLLDLFSGAGGAARGYQQAGFHVTGVDIKAQPRYAGDEFIQADALEYLEAHGREYDVIHASPPCHDHSSLASLSGSDGTGWLLDATRLCLDGLGLPYVIENVPGATMRPDIVLCGEMFKLRTIRHRWFELGRWWTMSPGHPAHTARTSTSKRRRALDAGYHISVTGDVGSYVGPPCMGIDWMTGNELSQAIPPAYCKFIGEQMIGQLALRGVS